MKQLGLRYVSNKVPGISRLKGGSSFVYKDASGKKVSDSATLLRIRQLVIPPAWKHVWICEDANGHLQATGKDARGRKQYRYHKRFRAHQDATKFANILEFALALPKIRRKVNKDSKLPRLPRERVLSTVVQLLERTLIRIGNQEYAEHNHSFGLSTLLNKHATHCADGVRFAFIGKSGVQHNVEVNDQRLSKVVFNCRDLPGQHLFEFKDEKNKVHAINSADVNQYIQACSRQDFSAKNFRTWRGTVIAALAFERLKRPAAELQRKKAIAGVIKDVSLELRNTPATCKKYYIHPKLIKTFDSGKFNALIKKARRDAHNLELNGLSMDEKTVFSFLS